MCTHECTLVFHSLVSSWTFQLALGTALMLEYLCDNIWHVFQVEVQMPLHHRATAIRDPYLVSCTFYACWWTPLFKFQEFMRRISRKLSIYARTYIYYPNPPSSPSPPLFPQRTITIRKHMANVHCICYVLSFNNVILFRIVIVYV